LRQAVGDLLGWKLVLRLGKFLIGLPLMGRPEPMPPWTDYPGGRVISDAECLVRDNLQMLGIFATLATNGLASSVAASPDPASVAAVIANCWLDRSFQTQLVQAAASVLNASGITVRPEPTVRILIDDPRRVHFVLAGSPLDRSLRLDSLPPTPSFLQLYAYVYEAARRDERFRSMLIAQPGPTLRMLGLDVADDMEVVVCEADSDRAYLSIPTVEQISMPSWHPASVRV